jgi:hypothetical protein
LNLLEAFESRQSWPWPDFKSGERCRAGFSKEMFGENISGGFKNWQERPGQFLKAARECSSESVYPIRKRVCTRRLSKALGRFKSFWR